MESSPSARTRSEGHLRIPRNSVSAYRSAYEIIKSPVWFFDLSRHAIWWGNAAALRFWNARSSEELASRDFSGDSHMVRQRLRQVFETTPPGEHATDTWTLYPKGQPTIVSLHMTPVLIEDLREAILIEAHSVASTEDDASALRILEAARNTPLRVSTASLDGEVLSGNPAALDSYGVIEGDGEGRNKTLGQRIADPAAALQILGAARDNRVFSQDIEVETVHGRRWHHVTARRGRDPLSGDYVIVLTEEDVTERRDLYQQLYELNSKLEGRVRQRTKELEDKNRRLESLMQDAQAAKLRAEEATHAKSTFLASMSHELRTPLNAILGFSDVMHGELLGPMPERYSSYAKDINASATHLLGLINDLLDLSSIEEGRLALEEERVEVEAFIGECMRYVTPQANARPVTLTVTVSESAGAVWIDRRRLCQVLVNVLSNAVKFTPPEGEIAIRAWRTLEGLAIEVRDNGAGIPPEELDKVMEPYRSGKVAKADVEEGTGLGLHIAKALMECHDGFIFLDSVLGEGTTVRLELPKARLVR